jgi:glycosyltransferase involved in cell wall biosynthesis
MKTNPNISVISGCYNEEGNIEEFCDRVCGAFDSIKENNYELILIDNASTDGTQEKIRKIAAMNPRIKAIFNSRNFGHIRSPYHALMQATGNAVICMASDLQDPPEMIPKLIEEWRKGVKTVVCVKESSEESPVFFLIRRTYYALVHRLSDTKLIQNFTGFGLYDRAIVDYCRKVDDPYPYFRGQISEIGLPIKEIPYRQPLRKRGITKNNFFTLYDLAMLGITSHSKVPLRLATMLGFSMAILSLLVAFVYLIYKLVFWYTLPVGTAPLVIGLFFFASVQLFFIGILGEYIGAIHTQVLKRPLVVEKERINFKSV